MIDFIKDLVDMCPIKSVYVKEVVFSFLTTFVTVLKGFIVFFTLFSMFASLANFMYLAFYLHDLEEWCAVYIVALPILTWVNTKI